MHITELDFAQTKSLMNTNNGKNQIHKLYLEIQNQCSVNFFNQETNKKTIQNK